MQDQKMLPLLLSTEQQTHTNYCVCFITNRTDMNKIKQNNSLKGECLCSKTELLVLKGQV